MILIGSIILIAYILNLYFNRWLFFRIGDLDERNLSNPIGKFFCFLSLLGSMILMLIYLLEAKWEWYDKFFTPKK